MFGMIHTCGDFIMNKSLRIVYMIMNLIPLLTFAIHLHVEAIFDLRRSLKRF